MKRNFWASAGENEKEERGDKGEAEGEPELAANEEGRSEPQENQERNKNNEDKSKEINEMLEPEFDDEQTDPYHGNQPELPEPEPMDLPDDLQCDDQEGEQEEQQDENPFDIDKQKGLLRRFSLIINVSLSHFNRRTAGARR